MTARAIAVALVLAVSVAHAAPWRAPRARTAAAAGPFISYTGPAVAGSLMSCADSTAQLPLTGFDSLRVEALFRRQAPTWPTLAARLAAGDAGAWAELWPTVKREADSIWIRVKPFSPGVRDTLRAPITGPGLNVELTPLRRGDPGNRGCVARDAVRFP